MSRHIRSEVQDVRATSPERVRGSRGRAGPALCLFPVACPPLGGSVEPSPSSAVWGSAPSLTLGSVNLYKSSFLPGGRSPTLASTPCGTTVGRRGSHRVGTERMGATAREHLGLTAVTPVIAMHFKQQGGLWCLPKTRKGLVRSPRRTALGPEALSSACPARRGPCHSGRGCRRLSLSPLPSETLSPARWLTGTVSARRVPAVVSNGDAVDTALSGVRRSSWKRKSSRRSKSRAPPLSPRARVPG